MSLKKKLSILKIVLINAIPGIGFFFFDWELFEFAVIYLTETFILFIVFFVDRYFIVKETRYPFVFALIQLFFVLFAFTVLIYAYITAAFYATNYSTSLRKGSAEAMLLQIDKMELQYIAIAILAFEIGNFIIKKNTKKDHKEKTIWFNLRKLLIIHVYLMIVLVISTIIPHNLIIMLAFIIIFKILLDYAVEDVEIMNKIRNWLVSLKYKK